MRAPVSSSPPILGSPTLPAPTIRHGLPVNFRNMGNRLVTDSSSGSLASISCMVSPMVLWQVTRDRFDRRASEQRPQLGIVVTGKEAAQIFAAFTLGQISAK